GRLAHRPDPLSPAIAENPAARRGQRVERQVGPDLRVDLNDSPAWKNPLPRVSGQNIFQTRQSETVPETLITAEEKCPVLHHRPAGSEAKLVALERRFGDDIEEITRIQRVIAQELEHRSVELIAS